MKMRRAAPLGRWIFFQFLLLLVVMTAPLFALVLLTTESGFRGYVYQGDVSKALAFAPILEEEFQKKGTWEAVEPRLSTAPFSYHSAGEGPGQEVDWIRERIVILDTARKVVVDTKHVLAGTLHPPEHLADAVLLTNPQGWHLGYLLVGTMVDPALAQDHESFLSNIIVTLCVLFVISLGLVLPLAFWLGARLTRPLRNLVEATQRVTAEGWEWEAPARAPREVQELTQAFQRLGEHLRASEQRRTGLLADATHELRTPLTVVRGTLEALLEGVFPLEKEVLKTVYAETLRLEKIVESLRHLERLDDAPPRPEAFAWRPLVDHGAGLFQAPLQEKSQTLILTCPPDAVGWGEPQGVQQILVNLLSNATRHAPPGGRVAVTVAPTPEGETLTVDDDGPGIPESERERIFERFVRLDPSRSGSTGGRGLGLAIVKRLAQRHGGGVRVVESPWGGARFEVWFERPPRS